jgi:hypothetical protein
LTSAPDPRKAVEGRPADWQRAERQRRRRFGLTIGTAFLILAAFLYWKQRPTWPIFASLGGLSILLGLVVPLALGPVERIWMKLARAMGWVMTRVILGIIFLLLFTPAGLIMRLLGKDPMELRFDDRVGTYWHKRPPRDPSPERMERMF